MAVLLAALSCGLCAFAKSVQNDVVWNWTKAFKRRVESLKISPTEASKLVWKAGERAQHPISSEPGFIVGRWYWFGLETKADAPLAGYYVNGDSGMVEYRESKKMLKSGAKKLPKDPWSKITPVSAGQSQNQTAPGHSDN